MESKNGVESVGGGCHAKAHVEGGEQQQDAISPRRVLSHELLEVATAGAHFTCFTGTKVQTLTQSVVARVCSRSLRLVLTLLALLVQRYKY